MPHDPRSIVPKRCHNNIGHPTLLNKFKEKIFNQYRYKSADTNYCDNGDAQIPLSQGCGEWLDERNHGNILRPLCVWERETIRS